MRNFKLSPRLDTLAGLAQFGKRIVDVGTDHGHIPVWLALYGRTESITATDIRRGPLKSAVQSALEYGVRDRIRFVLCDGLDFAGASDSDTVIIAGMGGETIISILGRAPWTKGHVTLLLQPQSKLSELCVWLAANHYALCGAVLVEDAGRLYAVLSVQGAAEPQGKLFVEDMLLRDRDPLLPRWLDEHISSLAKAAAGLSQAKEKTGADGVRETLERFIRAREETKAWRQSEK